jgi:hypothetical protein
MVDKETCEAIRQAVREVLLSDEFLRAFAAAFVNTPLPSTIQAIPKPTFQWSSDVTLTSEES